MKTIWKYQLATTDHQVIEMPAGAQILCVQIQAGTPCLWALVDGQDLRTERRSLRIFGTGHSLGSFDGQYIGTYQLHGGGLVFHVFEERLAA